MWWIFPKIFQRVGIPQGSRSGRPHFLLYWAFSLFWCPAQSLYSPGLAPELPPGPPPGPDWILLLQKALIYESRAPSLRHAAVCRQEREVVHHTVCVLRGRVTPWWTKEHKIRLYDWQVSGWCLIWAEVWRFVYVYLKALTETKLQKHLFSILIFENVIHENLILSNLHLK